MPPGLTACRRLLKNRRPCSLNAFDRPFSGGFAEARSNAVKALKRAAFGFRNFTRLRARVAGAVKPACPDI